MRPAAEPSALLPTLFVLVAGVLTADHGSAEEPFPVINEVMSSNAATLQDEDGAYPDWIEIYNPGASAVVLTGYGLTDDEDDAFKWVFPPCSLEPGHFKLVFASGKDRPGDADDGETGTDQSAEGLHPHTNFKVRAAGEIIVLTGPSGTLIDRLNTGAIPTDHSLGRFPDGDELWIVSNRPTPGESNSHLGFTASVTASVPGGFHHDPLSVELSVDSPSAVIGYTLDGSDPSAASPVYGGPIDVAGTTVLRARAFEDGLPPGAILTNTYFVDQDMSIAAISLATDPANFFDDEIGIYVMGNNANGNWPYWGANFREDWERPAHIEFYEPDGQRGFSMDAGVKIQGGYTRGYPQKSLAIYARRSYGYSQIPYRIFPDLPIDGFEAIVLRNSSNDFLQGLIRDPLMHSLGDEIGLDVQAYRPAVVFINGAYWGIHNVREKQNEHYLRAHHGVDPDNVDRIAPEVEVLQGDDVHFRALVDYVIEHDLSQTEPYEHVGSQVDLDNLIDYTVAEIYFANNDWPHGNNDCWRPRTPEGRWRWLLYDTDTGFGVNSRLEPDPMYTHNTLEIATTQRDWQTEPMLSSLLLDGLLHNEDFRYDFINRFADYSNTVFHSDHVIMRVREMKEVLEPEVAQHFERWRWRGDKSSYPYILFGDTIDDWYTRLGEIEEFAENRLKHVRRHFVDRFGLSGLALVELNVSEPRAGKLLINSVVVEGFPWEGYYFRDVPLTLTAIPEPGFQFVAWTGITPSDVISTTIVLSDSTSVVARFEPTSSPGPAVVINEINYNSSNDFSPGDWVELHNHGANPVDLSGWMLKDEDDAHTFALPDGVVLDSQEYTVLCRDTTAFASLFPEAGTHIGNLDFGLSRDGELVRLLDPRGLLVDWVAYDDRPPWPVAPDGQGAALALIDPALDNNVAESWGASLGHGTPGGPNQVASAIVEVDHGATPDAFGLGANYPNPFNSTTVVHFSIPAAGHVDLAVYNLRGQKVRDLVAATRSAGTHRVRWSGEDDRGNALSSGVYVLRLRSGYHTATGKMLLLR